MIVLSRATSSSREVSYRTVILGERYSILSSIKSIEYGVGHFSVCTNQHRKQ
ncbi:hypothetical protein Plhal304r1_c029g0096031 [Plasmopara halstedii]